QVGEDRWAERVAERRESGGHDEVLGECTADPPTLSEDEATRTPREAESLHLEDVDQVVPSARDGSGLQTVLEAQVAEHLLERQLRQIVHRRYDSVHFQLKWFSVAGRFGIRRDRILNGLRFQSFCF